MESAVQVVSNEVYANQVKLFGKWNCDEVDVDDISLKVSWRRELFKFPSFNFLIILFFYLLCSLPNSNSQIFHLKKGLYTN